MTIREALEEIRVANGGRMTRQIVVDAARPDGAPLHNQFEWDDSVAGEKYRLAQAGDLIRSVRIAFAPAEDTSYRRVAHYVSVNRPSGRAYEPAEEVLRDPIATQLVIREMDRDWRSLRTRYESFAEFWSMIRNEVEIREVS